jgi:hypothetical protein
MASCCKLAKLFIQLALILRVFSSISFWWLYSMGKREGGRERERRKELKEKGQ